MTYELERFAITEYFTTQWAGATPVGRDGHAFEPSYNSVRLTIKSGDVWQGGIGRSLNTIHYLGLLTASIYTEGGRGTDEWRGYAETIQTMLFEKTLDQTGAVITSVTDAFVRFSPPHLPNDGHPYIGADFDDPPFHITNVIAPFIRYGLR